jgi:hypothetical protein
MTTYFTLMRGLRGCYMPDGVEICGVDTFRDFCRVIQDQISFFENGDGDSDLRSTGQMHFAWSHVKNFRNACREVCVATDKGGSYGLLVSPATEAEFREYETQLEE